jgi:hypothetical protein
MFIMNELNADLFLSSVCCWSYSSKSDILVPSGGFLGANDLFNCS